MGDYKVKKTIVITPIPPLVLWKVFKFGVLRFLAGNYFECGNTSNYRNISTTNDYPSWEAQCGKKSCPLASICLLWFNHACDLGQYCEEDISQPNVIFNQTQQLEVMGICQADFTGSPLRKCLHTGIQRIWDDAIDPCQRELFPLFILFC